MSNISIRVENLSKKYHIGRKQDSYKTLRDTISDTFILPFRKVGNLLRGQTTAASDLSETIWALENVSFEVMPGEVIGIIGGNGAGKSTLLKILSRITEPTKGFAEVHGRVGSLLEVGTGFHPELTGRENVYLNGAILGMKRYEINRKFDEIVAFSEVEKFIDTPVKHYSSGMFLRLAFAVAAHLEPEILIVDEVLAVGDANFQKKCLNKMESISREGHTVICVSHNMMVITRLCDRAIHLEEGRVKQNGRSQEVVSAYIGSGTTVKAVREWPDPEDSPGGNVARLREVKVRTANGQTTGVIDIRHPITVEMGYKVLMSGYMLMPNMHFFNEHGVNIFSTHDIDPEWRGRERPKGDYVSRINIPGNLFSAGIIFVSVGFETIQPSIFQFYEQDVVSFDVIESFDFNTARGDYKGRIQGTIRPLLKWTTQFRPDGSEPSNS